MLLAAQAGGSKVRTHLLAQSDCSCAMGNRVWTSGATLTVLVPNAQRTGSTLGRNPRLERLVPIGRNLDGAKEPAVRNRSKLSNLQSRKEAEEQGLLWSSTGPRGCGGHEPTRRFLHGPGFRNMLRAPNDVITRDRRTGQGFLAAHGKDPSDQKTTGGMGGRSPYLWLGA